MGNPAGFTLLEVLLAIAIASAILAAVMFFYQQTSDLRVQLLQETQRISTVRLLMDRITSDLRCAYNHASPQDTLVGNATSITFVKTDVPSRSVWNIGAYGRLIRPETDLRRVSYSLSSVSEGTNTTIAGLDRVEKPLVEPHVTVEAQMNSTNAPTETAVATNAPPLTDAIQFLHFRYWDGANWLESWDKGQLPLGVEVNLGWEPLPDDSLVEEYPYELFRRVIFLPGSGSAKEIASEEASTNSPSETMEGMP